MIPVFPPTPASAGRARHYSSLNHRAPAQLHSRPLKMRLLLHDFRASPTPGLAGGFFLLDPDAALLEQFAGQCQLHVTCLQVLPEASQ